MIRFIKSFLLRVKNILFWKVYNFRTNSRIYNYSLNKSIVIGKEVMVRAGTELGKDVTIGDYSYISGPINYIEAAEIGKFCSIARQTVIGVSDHNYNWVTTHPIIVDKTYRIIPSNEFEPQKPSPVIGNDVWIGINAIIQRGVVIGDGAVVAAGSIVTKNVEPYSIVGGVPAKHLKYRFNESQIESLLKIQWWHWEKEKIKSESQYMYDINLFIARNLT